MKEQVIMRYIQAELNRPGCPSRVWRNNVGEYKRDGAYIKYGLAPGSADLIGIVSVTITPDMVGQRFGRFLAAEIKTPTGRLSAEQQAWLKTVSDRGGLSVVLRSVEEAKQLIVSCGGDGNGSEC